MTPGMVLARMNLEYCFKQHLHHALAVRPLLTQHHRKSLLQQTGMFCVFSRRVDGTGHIDNGSPCLQHLDARFLFAEQGVLPTKLFQLTKPTLAQRIIGLLRHQRLMHCPRHPSMLNELDAAGVLFKIPHGSKQLRIRRHIPRHEKQVVGIAFLP